MPYNLWAMKEPDYIMTMMATRGSLIADKTCRSTTSHWIEGDVNKQKEFAYTQPFDHHSHYHHVVDNHNNLCHSVPSWNVTWVTHHWERCMSFCIYFNTFLAL